MLMLDTEVDMNVDPVTVTSQNLCVKQPEREIDMGHNGLDMKNLRALKNYCLASLVWYTEPNRKLTNK